MQNSELAWRRIEQAYQDSKKRNGNSVAIGNILADLLQLKKGEKVYLGRDNIFVRKESQNIPLRAMSDGYQSIITLVLDFLFWVILKANATNKNLSRYNPLKKEDLHGIFIIDEIETHLHPIWQKELFHCLQQQFPEIQFIASTHSPLVISGSGKAPTWFINEEHSLSRQDIDGWLAEYVYREMGLDSSRPNYKQDLIQYSGQFCLRGSRTSPPILKLCYPIQPRREKPHATASEYTAHVTPNPETAPKVSDASVGTAA